MQDNTETLPQKRKRAPRYDYHANFPAILASVSAGNTLTATSKKLAFSPGGFFNWLLMQPIGVYETYARARQCQAEVWADEICEIAANPEIEWGRARLLVDTKKWLLAKNHAKRFGDRSELTVKGDNTAPLVVSWGKPPPKSLPNDTNGQISIEAEKVETIENVETVEAIDDGGGDDSSGK